MLYGFNKEHARILKRVARREGLRAVVGTRVRYPQPLPDELVVYLGKTDAAITKSNSGNVSRWKVVDGVESDTGETDVVKNKFANVAITKWCAYVSIGGTFYMIAAEC